MVEPMRGNTLMTRNLALACFRGQTDAHTRGNGSVVGSTGVELTQMLGADHGPASGSAGKRSNQNCRKTPPVIKLVGVCPASVIVDVLRIVAHLETCMNEQGRAKAQ
mmetsp:Transcript_47271/g.102795  ORF Transcript_47271/g.102795 Transcript_47271/m.102795 type:complete len:107 (-) Transcript_47271:316-636(-)